ncbi:hypothetical protein BV25DRAFT_1416655 [Artomyces pyxidatus]|uniref:Uncharacterized protein n=1 Tax=Artomyces pyxidatus TaxID=48021 RepID=A0ACB8TE18_9AGAM|nr:hypothetical protein BV25DRAFT_1416655 [Artomyces pyxidatus]
MIYPQLMDAVPPRGHYTPLLRAAGGSNSAGPQSVTSQDNMSASSSLSSHPRQKLAAPGTPPTLLQSIRTVTKRATTASQKTTHPSSPYSRPPPTGSAGSTLHPLPPSSSSNKLPKDSSFPCPVLGCAKSYTRAWLLERHTTAAHAAPRFACPVAACPARFKYNSSITRHMRDVHAQLGLCADVGSEAPRYKCAVAGCGREYARYGYLRRHAGDVHGMAVLRESSFVGKVVIDADPMGLGGEAFGCEVQGCSEKFQLNSELAEHLSIEHGHKSG